MFLRTPGEALSAGVEGLAHSGGIAGKGVGGRERVEDEFGGKTCLEGLFTLESCGIEQLGDELAAQQVLLLEQKVDRVVGIGRVREPFVAALGSHGTGCVGS